MKNVIIKLYYLLFLLPSCFVIPAFAAGKPGEDIGLGNIAKNVFNMEIGVHEFLQAVCITSAVGMFLNAIVKYNKHRRNPIAVPLSASITSLIIGILLVILVFIPLTT
jgi:hypothetical protein